MPDTIVDNISAFVPLVRTGRHWKGLCPFHEEKTPSFHVDPMAGRFHCFGCGLAGDALDFLKLIHMKIIAEARQAELAAAIEMDAAEVDLREFRDQKR